MKVQWCWRCRADVPMLGEDEHACVSAAYQRSLTGLQSFIREAARVEGSTATLPSPDTVPTEDLFSPVQDEWGRITGQRNLTTHALKHHRLSLYGRPCTNCGKPLRTAKARSCAACGGLDSPTPMKP